MGEKLILAIACLWLFSCVIHCEKTTLTSKIKTQQKYRSSSVQNDQIYSIEVNRMSSTNETELSRCRAVPKSIEVSRKAQIFRLSKGEAPQNREQKVYQKLTSLNEQQNIIEQFEMIGDKIFLITTDGTGYFIQEKDSSLVKTMKTNFFEAQKSNTYDLLVIKNYKDRALIVGRNKIIICRPDSENCEKVEGFEPLMNFRGAQLYQDEGRYFLFLITGDSIIRFELTANDKLKDKTIYDQQFFGVSRVSIRGIYRADQNTLLVLDDLQGVREMVGHPGLTKFKPVSKLVFEQFGCYQIVGQDKGQSLVLACAPTINSYFLLKLIKSRQFAEPTYEPHETVFLHEKLYQIDYIQNILLSRVFSGLKLYWSSKQLGNPYPFFYRNAASIFLHNAIQAKIKITNGVKTIFLAAEDEILKFELKNIDPYVVCYSNIEIKEEYSIKYHVPCKEQAFVNQQNICQKEEYLNFEVWEHKEIKITTLVIPFILSFFGVIGVSYAIFRIYKKYNVDVENARIKYNIQENQLDT